MAVAVVVGNSCGSDDATFRRLGPRTIVAAYDRGSDTDPLTARRRSVSADIWRRTGACLTFPDGLAVRVSSPGLGPGESSGRSTWQLGADEGAPFEYRRGLVVAAVAQNRRDRVDQLLNGQRALTDLVAAPRDDPPWPSLDTVMPQLDP